MSWAGFWSLVFFFSFGSFTLITVLIAVKGVAEIRELLAGLKPGAADRPQDRQ